MTFMRKFNTLLHKSNNKIYIIDAEDGINLSIYDINFNLLNSHKILNGKFAFIDYWFDLTSSDEIYGVINNKIDSLIHVKIYNNSILKNTILKYDFNSTFIKFVSIKKYKDLTHIFYYKLDKLNSYYGKLINHYKNKSSWTTSEIDVFSYNILTNFIVTYDDNFSPHIFYYKIVNGFEELFVSNFDSYLGIWSNPQKLTNSKKSKIYLSAIKDSKNYYHIIYSENNSNKYYCTYIRGYFENGVFIQLNNLKLNDTVACTFPNIIEYNDTIYAQWIEYHNLYVSMSHNGGYTWDKASICGPSSTFPFNCCNYRDNYSKQNNFNYFTLFTVDDSDKILGLD